MSTTRQLRPSIRQNTMSSMSRRPPRSCPGLEKMVESQVADAKSELERHVMVCIEDDMGTAQSQFEDFVRNEIHSVGDDIEDTVRTKLIDALS